MKNNLNESFEQQTAQEKLLDLVECCRPIFKAMYEHIWILNLNFEIVYINPSIAKAGGYSIEEIQSIPLEQNIPPDHLTTFKDIKDQVQELLKQHLREYQYDQNFELEIYRKDRSKFWLEIYISVLRDNEDNPIGLLGIGRDIDERKHIEYIVRENEEKYRLLYTSMSEGVALQEIITDNKGAPVDYRFLDVNPRFEELTGYTRNEIIGRTASQVFPSDQFYKIKEYGEVAISGQPKKIEEYSLPKDKYFQVFVYSPKKGQFAIILSDITERKKAEEELKNALKEKEILIKEIHHRVKNNLQVISSILHLQEYYIDDSQAKTALRDCQNRVRSMSMVHEKLYQSKSFSNIDVKGYVENLIFNLYRSFAMEERKVHISMNIQPIELSIDNTIVCGLLLNEMLTNAFKYAFPDGRKGSVHIDLLEEDNEITFSVSDDGIGLPYNFNLETAHSLGMKLIQSLSDQLGGKLTILKNEKAFSGTDIKIILSKQNILRN